MTKVSTVQRKKEEEKKEDWQQFVAACLDFCLLSLLHTEAKLSCLFVCKQTNKQKNKQRRLTTICRSLFRLLSALPFAHWGQIILFVYSFSNKQTRKQTKTDKQFVTICSDFFLLSLLHTEAKFKAVETGIILSIVDTCSYSLGKIIFWVCIFWYIHYPMISQNILLNSLYLRTTVIGLLHSDNLWPRLFQLKHFLFHNLTDGQPLPPHLPPMTNVIE